MCIRDRRQEQLAAERAREQAQERQQAQEREKVAEKFRSIAGKREAGAHGYGDHNSDWKATPEALRKAVEASDSKVLLVASGSLSHKIWPNRDYAANNGTFTISSEFNRQVDLHVLDMWQRGDHATFLKMLPDYAQFCCGTTPEVKWFTWAWTST